MSRSMSLLFALVAGLATSTAQAGYYTYGSWSTSPDEGNYEAYGEAVDDWSGTENDSLDATISGTQAFLNYMVWAGHAYRFSTDSTAWSSDFEEPGSDDSFNDAADSTYVSTHGSSATFYLNGNYGDDVVSLSQATWGESDSERIYIDACQVLNASGRATAGSTFLNDGIHYVFGFESNASDITTTAELTGYYAYYGYALRTAWISATQAGHSSSYSAAYVRFYNSSCDTYGDSVYSASCDPKSGSSYITASWTL